MESVILLFETLGYALDGDVTFNLSLLIELDACLKLSKLGLFALSESALGGSVLDASTTGIRSIAMLRRSWGEISLWLTTWFGLRGYNPLPGGCCP